MNGAATTWRLPIDPERGSPAGHWALELVTDRSAGAGEPFVTAPRDPLSRAIAARLVGPNGGEVLAACLELQSDDYALGERSGLTNPEIDALWAQRWRLWRAAAAEGAAPAVLDLLPVVDDQPPRLPPILYCRERDAYFVPPCADCGAPLATCRDDRFLLAREAPAYGQSVERFLYCPACGAAGRDTPLYSLQPLTAERRARGAFREQRDLYRGFAGPARRGDARLPCVGCAGLEECYPAAADAAGRAPRVILPVTFHEAICVPTAPLGLAYDVFAAQLGGAPPAGGESAGAFEERYGQRRYLFEADPSGKLPLEILRLKLVLFAQLAAAVSHLHRATQLPHLALSPEMALVEMGPPAPDVPRLYNFQTRVIGIGGAVARRAARRLEASLRVPLLDPPLARDTAFTGSLAREQASPEDGQVVIRDLQDGEAGCTIRAELTCDSGALDDLGDKDVVLVSLAGRGIRVGVEWAAYGQLDGAGRAQLTSLPGALDADARALLTDLRGGAPVRATITVLRCLHAPADLQSLGLLLFTTLLANRVQGAATITAAARRVADSLLRLRRDQPSIGADALEDEALTALRRGEAEGVFARRQLFDDPSAHADPSAAIPDSFWFPTLLLGVRALTQLPGFGLCRAHGDFDPSHPEGPAERLRVELGVLTQKIEAELLGRHGMRMVFADALSRVMGDLAGGRRADRSG